VLPAVIAVPVVTKNEGPATTVEVRIACSLFSICVDVTVEAPLWAATPKSDKATRVFLNIIISFFNFMKF